ncbi:hypothetical protein EWH99_08980 [Sporolactobacillus sp. THM7-7]|nr:hypothetical protein EWH99_08980 [Sporolactobacillus sp. THM7-7]
MTEDAFFSRLPYTDPVLGDAFYDKFERAEENHAMKYGLDPDDPSRPVRGAIQNFTKVKRDQKDTHNSYLTPDSFYSLQIGLADV